MKRQTVTAWLWILVIVPAALEHEGSTQTTPEGEFGAGSGVPESSLKLCGPLPDDAEFIPKLRTGWAEATAEGTRLVFSNAALACGEDNGAAMGELASACIAAWSYRLTIKDEALAPGEYTLNDVVVGFDSMQSIPAKGGCSSCENGGGTGTMGAGFAPSAFADGVNSDPFPGATLEIFSADDGCITGRITGLKTGQITPPPPEFNGGFHAVRCVPGADATQ